MTKSIAPPKMPNVPAGIYSSTTAIRLATILSEYDTQIAKDASQIRTYVTNRLIEISKCGETKNELKALELLGKISDVSLFVEKSEIKITHTASNDLESMIRSKISNIIGVKESDLISDADFEEVENEVYEEENEEIDEEIEEEIEED